MARLRDLSSSTFSDELRHLERTYVRTGLALWRSAFQAWIFALQDAAEDAFGRESSLGGPKNCFRAFMRGARTYCMELTAVLPCTVDGLTQEAVSARRESTDPQIQEPANMPHMNPSICRRRVQVFIVDPDPKVPADRCMVWESPEAKLTDLTDEELWFEEALNSAAAIKEALEAHNRWRTRLTKPLEEVRFRDLQKKVVTIAQF
jgi:hypothetical protein